MISSTDHDTSSDIRIAQFTAADLTAREHIAMATVQAAHARNLSDWPAGRVAGVDAAV